MNYPCKMIQDLLPLYIDGICSEESKHATEKHLAECEACRKCHEAMNTTVDVVKLTPDNSEEIQKINSLKKLKKKLNQKFAKIILCAILAVCVVISGFYLLFFAPIRKVPIEDIRISVETELTDVYLSKHNMHLTTSDMEDFSHISCITITSDYSLRTVSSYSTDHVLYITEVTATLINNTGNYLPNQTDVTEFKVIDKVVFVDKDGTETVLWTK